MVLKTGTKDDFEIADDLISKVRDLLIEHNEKTGDNIETEYVPDLSESQQKAFTKFKNGENLLILGAAGCGKSKLVKEFHRYIKKENLNKEMYITSTTGISAYNVNGITINSFMGIGTGEQSVEVLLKRLRYKMGIKDRIKRTDILVIDEISMMSASVFEKLDTICKTLRKSYKPFGGIQLILTGDFLQLETVFNKNIKLLKNELEDKRLLIESDMFNNFFNKKNNNIIILKENYRQKSDPSYINLLLRIRDGTQTEKDINILKSRLRLIPKGNHVCIVNSNKSAQAINEMHLSKIKYPMKEYVAYFEKSGKNEEIDNILINELNNQFIQKGMNKIELKIGTRVMLTKNLDVSIGLVNGSVGLIDSFIKNDQYDREYPLVIFDNIPGKHLILPVKIELELDNCICLAHQIPLMLAYALTTHKVQGLTLDSAILDLETAFCNGQVYVALSRVKNFDGLYIKSFDPKKIKVNKKIKEFLDNLS